jgi:hypothetical protein
VSMHPALAAKRVAPVTGIDRYEALPKLEEVVSDARFLSIVCSLIDARLAYHPSVSWTT